MTKYIPQQELGNIRYQYHPNISGLMQILQFKWLRYKMTISVSPGVAKFVDLSLILFPNKYIFNLMVLTKDQILLGGPVDNI